MFNFKNKQSTNSNRIIPGLSKYWRYTTLDEQNNNNMAYNNNNFQSSLNSMNNNNYSNFSNQGNFTSPDDITLEISYDNFYTLGVDMMKKKKYAEELKKQIEEKQMRKKLEKQKKKLDDLNDEIRIEKERKIIEDRKRESNKRNLPKINITPYYPIQRIEKPIKIYTPPLPSPPKPFINQYKTPPKPKINIDSLKNYSQEIPRIKYVYRKIYNTEETKNFLREREEGLERFDKDMRNQLKMLKNDFNFGMKQLNDEVDRLNNGIKDKSHNFRYLLDLKVNELSSELKDNNNKLNIQTEHIYNVIRKSKDGKTTIQRFTSEPNFINYNVKTPNSFNGGNIQIINDDNFYDELANNNLKLPYINLSHCISYS